MDTHIIILMNSSSILNHVWAHYIYTCGDLKFDLLQIDDNFTQYIFNLLCSYGLLPHILQPTRVTENTATVIANILAII